MKKYFVLFMFLTLPTFSQFKMDSLWKNRIPDFGTSYYSSIQLSSNDSIVFANIYDKSVSKKNSKFTKLNAMTGEVIKNYINLDTFANFTVSRNGSYIIASGNGYLGLVDTGNIRYTTKIEYPKITSHHYNEDKGIITGYSFEDKNIKQFDIKTKQLIKQYDSNYFNKDNIELTGVSLTNIEDRMIYCFQYFDETGPKPGDGVSYSGIRVINNFGKILYEKISQNLYWNSVPKESKPLFALSIDGTKLAFFINDYNNIQIVILDLSNFQILNIVDAGSLSENLQFSNDGKYLYNGTSYKLIQIDLSNYKSYLVSQSLFREYRFNKTNDMIFTNFESSINAYKIVEQSSISNEESHNKFKIFLSPDLESLNINFKISNNYLVNMRIYNTDGKLIKELENKNYFLGDYNKEYNISTLPQGAYYLQIKLNNEIIYPALNFIKVN